jgi:hypothetical protein
MAMLTAFSCGSKEPQSPAHRAESREAKALLQGVWIDGETEEVMFRAKGDSIFYPDSTIQPACFKIYGDTLVLGNTSYQIEKQSEHVFWFRNHSGDLIKLTKNVNPEIDQAFVHDDTPQVLTYTEVVKRDSVVMYDGQRYHWYIAINPTRYKVPVKSYNADGMEVVNVYYDNIMHISVFRGAAKLFSTDVRKQQYADRIPADFLNEAVLSNMEFSRVDAQGFHFDATICKPDGASCYRVENIVSLDGRMNTRLVEY